MLNGFPLSIKIKSQTPWSRLKGPSPLPPHWLLQPDVLLFHLCLKCTTHIPISRPLPRLVSFLVMLLKPHPCLCPSSFRKPLYIPVYSRRPPFLSSWSLVLCHLLLLSNYLYQILFSTSRLLRAHVRGHILVQFSSTVILSLFQIRTQTEGASISWAELRHQPTNKPGNFVKGFSKYQ